MASRTQSIKSQARDQAQQNADEGRSKEVFYTEGTEALKAARIWIANYSLPRTVRPPYEALGQLGQDEPASG